MTPKFKQTRARSEEKKADQFERILEAGKQLFLEKGTQGFSMRNLAEKLDMTKNNLYNYIESKRELWIAIRNRFYKQFKEENSEILKTYGWYSELVVIETEEGEEQNGDGKAQKEDGEEQNEKGKKKKKIWFWERPPHIQDESIPDSEIIRDSILKLFEHFLDFTENDYDKFKMMFNVIEAPPSNKIGPYEKKYKEWSLLDGTTQLIQRAVELGAINVNKANLLSLVSYSLVMGISYIEMNRSDESAPPVLETMQLSKLDVSNKQMKDYTLRLLEYIFKNDL